MSIEAAVSTFTLPDTISWGGKNGKQLLAAPVVISKVRRPYLSASTADAVRGCAARMVFDRILPRVDDPFGPAELGTEAHAIFESLFNLPPEERTMSTVSRLMAELDQSDHGPKDERGRWLASVNQLVSGIFLVEDPTKIDVVANELKFEATINDVPVLGYIDRLGMKNGELTISDYKSGKVPNIRWGDKHGDQIRIYYSALQSIEAIAQKATRGELLYTSFNTVREADLSEDAVKITLRDFKTSWQKLGDMLEKGEFPTKPSKLCGWCPAKDACPASSTREDSTKPKPAPPKMYEDDNPADFIQPLTNSKTKTSSDPALVQEPESGARETEKPQQIEATQERSAKERSNMSAELKPWEEYDGDNLNLNSYAATASFGLTSMAFDLLNKFNQRTNGKSVYALAATFVKVINDANAILGGEESLSFQAGRHTRLRGALHTAVDTSPPPFGGDDEQWEQWVNTSTRRVAGIFGVALNLWENPSAPTPWSALIRTEKE